MERYLEAGKIVATHGLRGELKVYPYCDSAKVFLSFPRLYFDNRGAREVAVEGKRLSGKLALLKIREVDAVEDARRYIDRLIFFDRTDVKFTEEVHYIVDLLGSAVVDAHSEKEYGRLVDVTSNGAHDVYHVQTAEGLRFVPAVGEFVAAVDPGAKVIRIKPIPGMLED